MRIRQAMSLKSKSSYTFYPFYWSCSFVLDSPWSSQGKKHNYQLTPVNPLNINKYLMRFVVLLLNTLKEMFQISFILTTHKKYKVDVGKTYSYMVIYSSHNMSIFNWYMLREVLIIFMVNVLGPHTSFIKSIICRDLLIVEWLIRVFEMHKHICNFSFF